jgi:HD-like signal output (HDOD) protein
MQNAVYRCAMIDVVLYKSIGQGRINTAIKNSQTFIGEYGMGNDEAFDMITNRLDRLPTLPGIAIRVLEAVQKEEPDLEEIGYIISTDPPLSAEVLKIINSPFYGMAAKVTSVFHAIRLLGINAVKNLVLYPGQKFSD